MRGAFARAQAQLAASAHTVKSSIAALTEELRGDMAKQVDAAGE
jgi:hypothetical protein